MKEKWIVEFETLTRGIDPANGDIDIVMPADLFFSAKELNRVEELDRLCRKKAIRSFAATRTSDNHILFLNMVPQTIEQSPVAGDPHQIV